MKWPLVAAVLVVDVSARAQTPPIQEASPLFADPLLRSMVDEAIEKRPELLQARAMVQADREQVPQAGAFADPTLSVGLQNDGFESIEVGRMETSYYSVTLTQPLYWPGKQASRSAVAEAQVTQEEARLNRVRLSVEADVRRAYVDVLLTRGRMALLSKLESLWDQSEKLAKIRYEVGQGAQSDLMRAQLEKTRLRQQRWALEAEERVRIQALNRLRGRPLDEPIVTTRDLGDFGDPSTGTIDSGRADAEARSPELALARALVTQAGRRVELARKEALPDFAVSAGVMPRGELAPMWQVGLSVSLPIYAAQKQFRAIDESQARSEADVQGEEAVRQLLRLRIEERLALLDAVLRTNQLYRNGLLVQSEATVESTMSQYQVGRVTFASVLEAVGAYVNDQLGFLESLAQAQRLAIAQAELSLDPPETLATSSGGSSMPGAGNMTVTGPSETAGQAVGRSRTPRASGMGM